MQPQTTQLSLPMAAHSPGTPLQVFQAQACETLMTAYAPYGGVLTGDDLVERMSRFTTQPISKVAHWIVGNRLVFFEVRGAPRIPAFQFRAGEVMPLSTLVLAELSAFCDAFEMAE